MAPTPVAQHFVYASTTDTVFPRNGHARGSKFITACGRPIGKMMTNLEIRAGNRCPMCFNELGGK